MRAVRDLHDSGMGWRRIARELRLPASWVKDIVDFARRPFVRMQWPPTDGNGAAERLR